MCHVVQTVTTHAVFAVQVVQRPRRCQQPGNIRTMRHDENTMPQHDDNTERADDNTSDSAAHEQQPAHPRTTSTAGERALHPQTNDERPGHDDPRPRMQTTAHKRERTRAQQPVETSTKSRRERGMLGIATMRGRVCKHHDPRTHHVSFLTTSTSTNGPRLADQPCLCCQNPGVKLPFP
ncbi:uncharacterized protein LACBIDRAFT_314474 [Laccaria bicolor S238N-H82]|uniref:Predicted protein n=1 Tax=Laccaria bicolor (strain S238N-H82 / ATCC MYA-4686) TaxID=486041 RepID=B0DYM5_LACBS|nr:uncharacterized protein LACBIDRAFT_314474 [Laccaria bicolor S238N-H82]EDR00318.1 predicted protein [Laccaria bicolor S238N-H82]|eukprot:XP_001889070.1 predicted protein [Laccaria bicolor S238N-H82]